MSSKGTIINAWSAVIAGRLSADGVVSVEDADLIRALAINIISSWEREASKGADPSKMFADIYEANKIKAAGLIVAILEVIHNIGGLVDVNKTLEECWN